MKRFRQLLRKLWFGVPFFQDVREIRIRLAEIQRELSSLKTLWVVIASHKEKASNLRYGDPKRLIVHGFQTSSQNGEDGIITEIFRRISSTNRMFVEIGVGDGSENNTAFLVSQGWEGFWFDGNEAFLSSLAREDLKGHVRGKSVFITRENVDGLLASLQVPQEFDLLSLDVDQNTYYVWEGLSNYKPRVVVVEYNPVIPPQIEWKVNYNPRRIWDGTNNCGASLKALEMLGRRLGYLLVGCEFNGANAFFVREDLVENHFSEPFTSENHYEPNRLAFLSCLGHRSGILDRPIDP